MKDTTYIQWQYGEGLRSLITLWKNAGLFPIYFFSIPSHLSHLTSPWKRQSMASKKAGFHPQDMMFEIGFNITSRMIGAIMRLSLISTGMFFSILVWILFLPVVCIWIAIPGIGWGWYQKKQHTEEIIAEQIIRGAGQTYTSAIVQTLSTPMGIWICERLGYTHTHLIQSVQKEAPQSWDTFLSTLSSVLHRDGASRSVAYIHDLVITVFSMSSTLTSVLDRHRLSIQDIHHLISWYQSSRTTSTWDILWDIERMQKLPGIGADWEYGYTNEFSKFATDVTKLPAPYPLLVGREEEIKDIERILIRTEGNNALIIGDPGVDRHILVSTIARRLLSGDCLPQLAHKRILMLDLHAVISAKQSLEPVKSYLTSLIHEAAQAGNVIIGIDEIDRYVSPEKDRMDLTDVWETLARSQIPCIAITTPDAYHRYIERNTTVTRLFASVDILPPSPETVLIQLEQAIVPIMEKKYHIWITYPSLKKSIEEAKQYLASTPFPASSIDLLDQTCVRMTATHGVSLVLHPQDIDRTLSETYHIPIGDIGEKEKEQLQKIEVLLHERLVGQDQAVSAIADALRRSRLHLSSSNKPRASFLFLGPTGVGKTEAAKTLAHVYFGSEDAILRFDMSEFQKDEGMRRLIGSVDTNQPGELTTKLKNHPITILLFDEFEKSDKEIFNLFLPLLDEGYITDAYGKKVDAKNTYIIATSNAGAEFIREHWFSSEAQTPQEKNNLTKLLLEHLQETHIFSPEFLNRFDAVVVFTPLSTDQIKSVTQHMLEALNARLSKEKDHCTVSITPALLDMIAAGYDPEYGARGIQRIITEKVENVIAKKLLSGDIHQGETILIV